jgi:serine phosphatase RsbU (regulator of sigma subunit)/CheY-like chemotaxis protein
VDTQEYINIFIVDDNTVFSLTLKGAIEIAFKDAFIKVHSFETGENCLEEFVRVKPELVILDYHLNSINPGAANGLKVLGKIKKHNSKISVIMLTSNDDIDVALKSFHHGATDYVVKTETQFKKIINSVSTLFANKELASQNEEKAKRAVALLIANNGLLIQNEEKEKWAEELIIAKTQKVEIEKSKLVAEEKNKNITDSITYARRIQQAKLPKMDEIHASFPGCFIFFKPKDIVSGDFYFFHKTAQTVFIAVADCTGHGVPGALMSMIGSERLNDAVSLSSDPSEILNRLNKGIKTSLRQSESRDSTKDGMDIAFCSVNKKDCSVKYAGANRPLWIIRNRQNIIEEIKATKKAIGGFTEDNQQFSTHEIKLQPSDTFYIFSDGYVDQFGGKYGKKLMTKKFKEILLEIRDKSMAEQGMYLETFIEDWKAGTEQVDDILVIGVRL